MLITALLITNAILLVLVLVFVSTILNDMKTMAKATVLIVDYLQKGGKK